MTDLRMEQKGLNHAPGKLIILSVIFAVALLLSNIMAVKLFIVFGLIAPVALLAYPITFVIMDTVVEVWGKEIAKKLIIGGLIANIIATILLQLSLYLPSAPIFDFQEEYKLILGGVPRIAVASLLSYYASQMVDVTIFSKIKQKMNGGHLWVRNNASTMISQIVDSAIFITIAFAGTVPFTVLLAMIGGQYVIKFAIAIVDTPFVYLAVHWARKP